MDNNPLTYVLTTPKSLLEGTIVGTVNRDEAQASEELLCKHEYLRKEAWVQTARLAPMHIMYWGEAQEADPILAACKM